MSRQHSSAISTGSDACHIAGVHVDTTCITAGQGLTLQSLPVASTASVPQVNAAGGHE